MQIFDFCKTIFIFLYNYFEMSILDQASNNEGELDYHNRGFLPSSHALIKSDQAHFGALNPMDPNPMSFYPGHAPAVSNGHTSPEMNPTGLKEDIPNGTMGQVPPPGFSCPSPSTPGSKKSFVPDGPGDGHGNPGSGVVYPWMKRIHVSHGKNFAGS